MSDTPENPSTESTPDRNVITLNKIQVVTKEAGKISHSPVKIEKPTRCAQANSSGALSETSLEEFRAKARAAGVAFREALAQNR